MKNFLVVLFLSLTLPLAMQAQICGTVEDEAFMDRLRANKERAFNTDFLETRGNEVTYVPVTYHLIGETDGSNRVSEAAVLDMHCHMNEFYADQNIQFYIYELNLINNDNAYQNPGDAQIILSGNFSNKSMNVYIGLNATPPGGGGPGVTLGYYTPGLDWIVIKKSEVNGTSSTLPHEAGHYFSIAHPFRGWDCTSWDPAVHGNPVNSLTAPCPDGNNQFVPVEFANGSNCETAADLLCDTPADYNLGFGNPGCVYNGNCMDPNGDQVEPMEENVMGYFNGCANYIFTPQQKALIAADLVSRTNLDTDFLPASTTIDGTATLLQPAEGATTPAYNNVEFEWTAVPGANQYLLEIDIVQTFNITPTRLIVWGNYKIVQGLQSNKLYYWRVRPFNGYNTCAPLSERGSFTTGTAISTTEPEFVNSWNVFPNPLPQGSSLQVELNADKAFEATLDIRTVEGRVLRTQQVNFVAGGNRLDVPVANLRPGIYLVSIRTIDGVVSKRVAVL